MKKIIATLVSCFVTMSLWPEHREYSFPYEDSFESFAEYTQKVTGVKLDNVRSFAETDYYHSYWIAGPLNRTPLLKLAGDMFGVVFLSKDGQCVVGYGQEDFDGKIPANNRLRYELESNLFCLTGVISDFEIGDYLTTIQNAHLGSIYIYEIPKMLDTEVRCLYKPIMNDNRIARCLQYGVGIIIEKDNLPLCHFKLFFSEKGYKHKDRYISRLLDSIHI